MTTKVKTGVIADGAVGTTQLAADSVTAAKIVDGTVGTAEIADGTVAAGDLAVTLDLSSKTITPPAGFVRQVVNTQTGAVATGSTQIPADDTIPQITEGNEYMTLPITPKSATSKLKIEVTLFCASSAVATVTAALFQDATANAIAASSGRVEVVGAPVTISYVHYMTAGTTSSTTFRVRAGPSAAATVSFNGSGGTRLFGGVAASSITITEIAA